MYQLGGNPDSSHPQQCYLDPTGLVVKRPPPAMHSSLYLLLSPRNLAADGSEPRDYVSVEWMSRMRVTRSAVLSPLLTASGVILTARVVEKVQPRFPWLFRVASVQSEPPGLIYLLQRCCGSIEGLLSADYEQLGLTVRVRTTASKREAASRGPPFPLHLHDVLDHRIGMLSSELPKWTLHVPTDPYR